MESNNLKMSYLDDISYAYVYKIFSNIELRFIADMEINVVSTTLRIN